jgi:hypothetical protein
MEKNRFWTCCWQIALGCGVLTICIGAPLLLGSFWMGKAILTAALATPTEINTCSGMQYAMLHDVSRPKGEKVKVDSMQDLVVYHVSGDKITHPTVVDVPESLLPLQQDTASQQQIWDFFARIIPSPQRKHMTEYKIVTDGTDKFFAQAFIEYTVYPDSAVEKWSLLVDLADYASTRQYASTLLHEFGHMLTLNIDQIDYGVTSDKCDRFFRDPGCSRSDSYLQHFYDRFWSGTIDEWRASVAKSSPEDVKFGLTNFYKTHPDDFVSLYSTTAPYEDIAESWMHFLLSPWPEGKTMAEKKVLFFYDYPELVQLRSDIDGRICGYYNLPADS